ncbi:hypothetical protein [Acidovorax sp. NCPPB 3576]|uniref:hypothetical protein n=1 Tax=Acidovorax sp. NCPPB 3576 TaxID=2940488 RepID=UPI00234AA5BB|nr:hypothetical protein [Acidovorax sp. NCPPB 3576]WCM88829.1 hypothetical protein M5C98_01880 [Acidovorax sp. NCPPB 3576]
MYESPTTAQAAPASIATHALLWSHSQCALHVEPIADMLSSNRQAYTQDRGSDYVPIFLGCDDDCRKAAEAVRDTMHRRQTARNFDGRGSGIAAQEAGECLA